MSTEQETMSVAEQKAEKVVDDFGGREAFVATPHRRLEPTQPLKVRVTETCGHEWQAGREGWLVAIDLADDNSTFAVLVDATDQNTGTPGYTFQSDWLALIANTEADRSRSYVYDWAKNVEAVVEERLNPAGASADEEPLTTDDMPKVMSSNREEARLTLETRVAPFVDLPRREGGGTRLAAGAQVPVRIVTVAHEGEEAFVGEEGVLTAVDQHDPRMTFLVHVPLSERLDPTRYGYEPDSEDQRRYGLPPGKAHLLWVADVAHVQHAGPVESDDRAGRDDDLSDLARVGAGGPALPLAEDPEPVIARKNEEIVALQAEVETLKQQAEALRTTQERLNQRAVQADTALEQFRRTVAEKAIEVYDNANGPWCRSGFREAMEDLGLEEFLPSRKVRFKVTQTFYVEALVEPGHEDDVTDSWVESGLTVDEPSIRLGGDWEDEGEISDVEVEVEDAEIVDEN